METIPTARQTEDDPVIQKPDHKCSMKHKESILSQFDDNEDYFVVDDFVREVKKEGSCLKAMKRYTFLVYDGLGFWGTDVTKLDRLKRGKYHKPPGWFDRFKSFQYVVTSIILIIVFGMILAHEIDRIGDITTSTLYYEKAKNVSYPATESIPLMTTMYIHLDSVVN